MHPWWVSAYAYLRERKSCRNAPHPSPFHLSQLRSGLSIVDACEAKAEKRTGFERAAISLAATAKPDSDWGKNWGWTGRLMSAFINRQARFGSLLQETHSRKR